MACVAAGVWKPQKIEDGKRGEDKQFVSNIMITPIATLDPEIRIKYLLDSPAITLQTFAENNPDLKIDYELTPDQEEYIGRRLVVRYIARWPWRGRQDVRVMIALELVKP